MCWLFHPSPCCEMHSAPLIFQKGLTLFLLEALQMSGLWQRKPLEVNTSLSPETGMDFPSLIIMANIHIKDVSCQILAFPDLGHQGLCPPSPPPPPQTRQAVWEWFERYNSTAFIYFRNAWSWSCCVSLFFSRPLVRRSPISDQSLLKNIF